MFGEPATKLRADFQAVAVVGGSLLGLLAIRVLLQDSEAERDRKTLGRFLSPQKEYTFVPSLGRDGQRRDAYGDLLFKAVPGFEEVTQQNMDSYLRQRAEFLEEEADTQRRARAESGGYR